MSAAKGNNATVVYRNVIDDVVTRVRKEFVQEGVDEAVLDELRELWETKLLATGVLEPPPEPAAPPTQLGPAPQYYQPPQSTTVYANYTGVPLVAAYPAPAAGFSTQLGKPETFLQQPTGFHGAATTALESSVQQLQPSQPQTVAQAAQQLQPQQPGAWHHHQQQQQQQQQPPAVSFQQSHNSQQHTAQQQQPQYQQHTAQQQPQYQAPAAAPPAAVSQPQQGAVTQALIAYAAVPLPQVSAIPVSQAQPAADSRKRPYEGSDQGGPQKQMFTLASVNGHSVASQPSTIPQQDGQDDAEGGGQGEEHGGDNEEDDALAGLSSDDDGDDDGIENVVLAQFEKVSRTKTRTGTKWKCVMKNGIAHLNGRDIIFKKCNGEMEF